MKTMSEIRKRYMLRLIGRILVFFICLYVSFKSPQTFRILEGNNFFDGFSMLHLLWGIWIFDMILQIIPVKNKVALGSQKVFANRYEPSKGAINHEKLKAYIVSTTLSAYKVFIIWVLFIGAIAVCYCLGYIGKIGMFMITVFFYVCDLICVLIWCPFRLIMKNRCCTTCRIFNWDHLMMFSPMIFVGGFYAVSLVVMAVLAWLVWEICIMIYPERFCAMTNVALKCSNCTDKLCTHYCQKLRK